jgi:hypothetical protein
MYLSSLRIISHALFLLPSPLFPCPVRFAVPARFVSLSRTLARATPGKLLLSQAYIHARSRNKPINYPRAGFFLLSVIARLDFPNEDSRGRKAAVEWRQSFFDARSAFVIFQKSRPSIDKRHGGT